MRRTQKTKLLFICSSAIDRSPAAVDLFVHSKKYSAIAAGTHDDATRHVSQKLLDWADHIFIMSEGTNRHYSYLKKNFKVGKKLVHDLHVRDLYFRNDPRLSKLLRKRIRRVIDF